MTRGRFITFEGGEGSGKSTQAWLLADRVAAAGVKVRTTREPGGSVFAEQVRNLLLTPATAPKTTLAEALLFNAARADHLAETIRPALDDGVWVVCDRFADSTRAYQGHAGGLDTGMLDCLEAQVLGDTIPDLTFLLDLDPAIGLARALARRQGAVAEGDEAAARGADAYEARQLAFHRQIRAGFLAIASAAPRRIVVLDGGQPPEQIAADVWQTVAARLGVGTVSG